jgi:cytochrome c peroxidase
MKHAIVTRLLASLSVAASLGLSACGGTDVAEDTPAADSAALPEAVALAQNRAPAPPPPTANPAAPVVTDPMARLGQAIFRDTNLSEPRGTACVACHQPNRGFAGNHGSRIGVALGSQPTALGLRNAMGNAYLSFVPPLSFVTANGETEAVGGHFWDGRADTLEQQALGPLLNPLEMNNPSRQAVVAKIAAAPYANQFRQVFGANIFNNTDAAFAQIGTAIAAFERSAALQSFSSKYDGFVRGNVALTPAEARGMALFQASDKGNCAACHTMNPASTRAQDNQFTDFGYYATGIPRNTAIPRNADASFFDLGLCGPERTAPVLPSTVVPGTSIDNFCGKFRIPSLRNVAERPAFMHNGFFNNLTDVVRFYSTRNSNPQRWYGSVGVANDLPARYLGNIETTKAPFNRSAAQGPALSEAEISDIVAFIRTLSDGFVAP